MTPVAQQKMRDICLALPDTSEGEHFGDIVFRVKRRIFASCGEKSGVCQLVVQLEPDHAKLIVARDQRFEEYSRQKDCVFIDASHITDWGEIRELVLESYRLNAPAVKERKPRKK